MHNLLWNYEGKEHRLRDLHQDVREDRWMTWVMSILFDTYAGLASGFPCSVEEMDHPEVLKDRRPWEDDWLYLERTRRNMATAEASTPLRLTYTLFHDAEMGTSVDALSALCSTETSLGMTRMVQACFLVRRVMRFAREIKPQPSIHDDPAITLGAAAVLGCVAGESDGRSLHDALIQWYSTLRLDERVFESLSAFRTVTGEERARFEIQVPENQWSRNPLILHNSCLFLCALVLLHYPMFRSFSLAHPQQFPKTFRVNSPTDGIPIRVSCPEIFTLARRALVYIIHMCHIQAGLTKINLAPAPFRTPKNHATKMRDLSFTPDCPPVPPGLAVTPVIPLTILFVAMGDLTVNHTHSFAAKQEILASIEHTFLPVLDNMGRVTPLAVRLGCRLRSAVIKIVEGVVARQDSDILKWVDSVWTEEDE
ncbi:hypothetical protein BC832DRAFT_421047 [Gaertneriomyces semiglobifer]|nr:hypothetical protein BC832DRAFT_421047 [Gaertneriomyces semiglobifer]